MKSSLRWSQGIAFTLVNCGFRATAPTRSKLHWSFAVPRSCEFFETPIHFKTWLFEMPLRLFVHIPLPPHHLPPQHIFSTVFMVIPTPHLKPVHMRHLQRHKIKLLRHAANDAVTTGTAKRECLCGRRKMHGVYPRAINVE